MTFPHISVLRDELTSFFAGRRLRIFVDGTLGAGGHSEAILQAHPEIELLIGIDQDPTAREIAQKRLSPWSDRLRIVAGNFASLAKHLKDLHIESIDGVILDLGVSSMQFDTPERGFSFMHDSPLDMRMDPLAPLTAAEIVNEWSEQELGRIFRDYGEEKRWRAAARAIVEARKQRPIATTFDLAEALKTALRPQKKGLNPLTLAFQGLRIAVNRELDVLAEVMPMAMHALAPGGRLGVISFHSLEDRIVKNAMRFASSDKYDTSGIGGMFLDKDPEVSLLTRKPVIPGEDEIRRNPRSRSAKLRVIEKL